MGSEKVLEISRGGPGKSWKSPGFFSSERVGTLHVTEVVRRLSLRCCGCVE